MLNIEKYKDELIKLCVVNPSVLAKVKVRGKNELAVCAWTDCMDCVYYKNGECNSKAKEWLFSEYKEPEVDWSKVKVDTPILVTDRKDCNDEIWIKRYFSKYENGKVYAWQNGATSWSANGEYDVNSWKYAKLAERSEKNED